MTSPTTSKPRATYFSSISRSFSVLVNTPLVENSRPEGNLIALKDMGTADSMPSTPRSSSSYLRNLSDTTDYLQNQRMLAIS